MTRMGLLCEAQIRALQHLKRNVGDVALHLSAMRFAGVREELKASIRRQEMVNICKRILH